MQSSSINNVVYNSVKVLLVLLSLGGLLVRVYAMENLVVEEGGIIEVPENEYRKEFTLSTHREGILDLHWESIREEGEWDWRSWISPTTLTIEGKKEGVRIHYKMAMPQNVERTKERVAVLKEGEQGIPVLTLKIRPFTQKKEEEKSTLPFSYSFKEQNEEIVMVLPDHDAILWNGEVPISPVLRDGSSTHFIVEEGAKYQITTGKGKGREAVLLKGEFHLAWKGCNSEQHTCTLAIRHTYPFTRMVENSFQQKKDISPGEEINWTIGVNGENGEIAFSSNSGKILGVFPYDLLKEGEERSFPLKDLLMSLGLLGLSGIFFYYGRKKFF